MGSWFPQDASTNIKERLLRFFKKLPTSLERKPLIIIERVKASGWPDEFQLPGIIYLEALPVRTTFLHFLYPTIMPIFDKMVLRAVGVQDENANHTISVLKEYLPFAWELTKKYEKQFSIFTKELPIRVIDMALWINRGYRA